VPADLAALALAAMRNAYAPYSSFAVGAAVQSVDGRVFVGCNVENASYALAVCAERNAIGAAVVAGAQAFTAVAVASSTSPPAPPCGACRQVLREFGPDLKVILANPAGERVETTLAALLPQAFSPDHLKRRP
jgi:cytidine deaminase